MIKTYSTEKEGTMAEQNTQDEKKLDETTKEETKGDETTKDETSVDDQEQGTEINNETPKKDEETKDTQEETKEGEKEEPEETKEDEKSEELKSEESTVEETKTNETTQTKTDSEKEGEKEGDKDTSQVAENAGRRTSSRKTEKAPEVGAEKETSKEKKGPSIVRKGIGLVGNIFKFLGNCIGDLLQRIADPSGFKERRQTEMDLARIEAGLNPVHNSLAYYEEKLGVRAPEPTIHTAEVVQGDPTQTTTIDPKTPQNKGYEELLNNRINELNQDIDKLPKYIKDTRMLEIKSCQEILTKIKGKENIQKELDNIIKQKGLEAERRCLYAIGPEMLLNNAMFDALKEAQQQVYNKAQEAGKVNTTIHFYISMPKACCYLPKEMPQSMIRDIVIANPDTFNYMTKENQDKLKDEKGKLDISVIQDIIREHEAPQNGGKENLEKLQTYLKSTPNGAVFAEAFAIVEEMAKTTGTQEHGNNTQETTKKTPSKDNDEIVDSGAGKKSGKSNGTNDRNDNQRRKNAKKIKEGIKDSQDQSDGFVGKKRDELFKDTGVER